MDLQDKILQKIEENPGRRIEVMVNMHARVRSRVVKSSGFLKPVIEASVNDVHQFRAGTAKVELTEYRNYCRAQYLAGYWSPLQPARLVAIPGI